jgi:deazaflavin-dependent oxidoreductase (nitroreductase family)
MPELEIPPRGTRGTDPPGGAFLQRLFQPLAGMMVSRYRKAKSATPPVMMGFPTVLLTTIGARTGKEHTHVLGGFAEDGDRWLVVASKGGASTHPHWFINLCKNPDRVWLEIGNRRVKVRPTVLKGTEREAAYATVVAVAPRYGSYPKKTDREIPVIRLEPVPN